ncbi:Uncharacterised protein [Mycobacteroides abscessus subsp. abscessus]|nr:Uncharacterised protein [Mycobacteroides abscessus subsp. abscessus]
MIAVRSAVVAATGGTKSPYGASVGPMVPQLNGSVGSSERCPSHGATVDALRPACPSCIAGTAPKCLIPSTMAAQACSWVSFQRPVSYGESRPCAFTEVASVNTNPAPPIARLIRWVRCQSVGVPSSGPAGAAEY